MCIHHQSNQYLWQQYIYTEQIIRIQLTLEQSLKGMWNFDLSTTDFDKHPFGQNLSLQASGQDVSVFKLFWNSWAISTAMLWASGQLSQLSRQYETLNIWPCSLETSLFAFKWHLINFHWCHCWTTRIGPGDELVPKFKDVPPGQNWCQSSKMCHQAKTGAKVQRCATRPKLGKITAYRPCSYKFLNQNNWYNKLLIQCGKI